VHLNRQNALELFSNLKIILDIKQNKNTDEAELMVKLSPLYLEQIDIATQKGQAAGEAAGLVRGRLAEGQSLIIRQLTRKLRGINPETIESIHQLTLEQLESLGDALLDFNAIEDLHSWLNND
jgi:predicted transposase YdaD